MLSGVDFVCVPLKIVTDDGEYLDTAELDAVGMAQTLRSYKGKTGTSCPNVADWLAAYEGAEEVFVVTITGTLSGSYNAAQLAAEEYQQEHEGARVFVLDSLSAGPECRLLAERLAALVQAGCAFDDVAEKILPITGTRTVVLAGIAGQPRPQRPRKTGGSCRGADAGHPGHRAGQ